MADNTIANAIKFLKGEEKSLPAAKTEGQVYFAYKNVGTVEKPSYTGAIYIDTPIGGTQNRIKMTANADIADKAFNDSAGLSIRDTYLSSLGYTDDGKQTILIKGSGNNQTRIALPIASTTKSGIVTTDAQSFGGTKTFTTINSTNLTITGTSGFNYSGIETATESKARPIWFADSSGNGKPVINTNFTYNPVTQTLSVANLSGTADKATNDSGGQNIRSTYISSVEADKDNKYKYNFKTPTGAIRNSITIYDEFQKRSQVDATTDWNTLTSTGIYKVQMSAWGDATKMHSPNSYNKDLYSFGILLVFESIANDSEKRFTQIYIPHNSNISISGSAYKRMHNGSDITTDWQGWHPIARGLNWSELTGKPNYAGSSSAGGAATSANKLNTNAGSTTLPVYFSNGVPVVCSTSLGVSITGNAASATKLTSNAGSIIQPIYFKDGKPVATTYSLNAHVQTSSGEDFSTGGWKKMNGNVSGSYITVGYNNNPAIWNSGRYSASIVFGKYDIKGLLDCSCDTSIVTFGGASNHNSTDDNPYWYFKLSGTSGQTYTFPVTSKTLAANDGSNASGTWGISITGNAASANKLNTNAGSATQPIYFKDGKPVTTTYSLNATVKAGTSNRVAFYSGNNEISSASSLKYYTATNSKKANQTILRIWGTTYGNDATTMISGKASSLSWNDGGPQIQFSTSEAGSQDGALIFTDHDSAGVGASFHFVSNQSEWSVVSKRFVAKTSVIIGQENHTANNQGYNLYVNGTEYINGTLTAVGDCAFIAHNNEFNFVPTLKASTSIWFNHRQTGGQPTNGDFIINEYVFGNGANKALARIKDGLFSGAATYVRDSNNNTNNISITYSKAAQTSTSWLASWNGYELGTISPSNITAGKATKLATARTITLSGAVTGSVSFDGSANVTLTTSVNHTHSQYYDSNISRTKNTVLAAPNGADGKAVFRSLVAADIPTLTKSKISDFPTSMPASDVYAWAKASTKPTYTKAEIGLGNVDNTADSQKSVKYATTSGSATTTTKLQTYKQGSTTETYGTQYPLYAQWEDSSNLRLKVDNYTVKVNYADKAGSASSATNAATATKLQTARTISLTGSVTGSGTFDGSNNITITTSTNHSHSQYLPLAGGTMSGTSFITWPDSGNWSNNNNNVTFPVSRGGLQWYGQSDYVKLFSQETGNDNLELVLQFGDDNSNGLSIRNYEGNETARIVANGNIAAASLRVGNGSGSTINFCTNGYTAAPGAKIVAYNDRIEFVFA